mmetsp:Transcript_133360/g.316130  ORF Transcript_133360/g.316130 Transcript_133360/m.316130 type:complete len:374 (+) Transcript_133360:757-1878(+)
MQHRTNRGCSGRFKLLPLGQAQDLLVRVSKSFSDRHLQLLIPGRGLNRLLPEKGQDVSMQILCGQLGHLCSTMTVEHGKVHPELIHSLILGEPVLQLNLLARPAFRMHPDPKRICSDEVAFPLLLQILRPSVHRQGLVVFAQHDNLLGARLPILLAKLVKHSSPFPEIDRILVGAPDHVPEVHEDALGSFLIFFHQRNNEAKAFLGIPLSDFTFHLLLALRLCRFLLLRWSGCWSYSHRGGKTSVVCDGPSCSCCCGPLAKLNKFCRLNGFSHLLRLLHLPDDWVVVIIDLAEVLWIPFLLDVVHAAFDVQVEARFRVEFPLAGLLVHIPTASIRSRLIICETRRWDSLWSLGPLLASSSTRLRSGRRGSPLG